MSHAPAKSPPDLLQHGRATAVFHHIVQQRSNSQIFIPARFENQCSDSEQVRQVRHFGSLLCLLAVHSGSEVHSLVEAVAELSTRRPPPGRLRTRVTCAHRGLLPLLCKCLLRSKFFPVRLRCLLLRSQAPLPVLQPDLPTTSQMPR